MEDSQKKAHVEFLQLSHAQIRGEVETLKSMLRHLNSVEQDARKLAGYGENERVEAPPTPLHTAAEGFAKAIVRKLPGTVLDTLPSEVREFGAEADEPQSGMRSKQILLDVQKLVDELKKRVVVAITDRKRLEKELEKEGWSVGPA